MGLKKTCTSFGKAKGGVYRCKHYRKGSGTPPSAAGLCRHPAGPVKRMYGRCGGGKHVAPAAPARKHRRRRRHAKK